MTERKEESEKEKRRETEKQAARKRGRRGREMNVVIHSQALPRIQVSLFRAYKKLAKTETTSVIKVSSNNYNENSHRYNSTSGTLANHFRWNSKIID